MFEATQVENVGFPAGATCGHTWQFDILQFNELLVHLFLLNVVQLRQQLVLPVCKRCQGIGTKRGEMCKKLIQHGHHKPAFMPHRPSQLKSVVASSMPGGLGSQK